MESIMKKIHSGEGSLLGWKEEIALKKTDVMQFIHLMCLCGNLNIY